VTVSAESDLVSQIRSAGLAADGEGESRLRLLFAGVKLFSEIGYHETTTRHLSQEAGMSPAALYVHYRSKAELLGAIILLGHRQVVDVLESAVAEVGEDPVSRLRALARAFVSWHAAHIAVARISVLHLDAVPPEEFEQIRRQRARIVELFENEIRAGERGGEMEVPDVHYVALAIISLGLDLARWYSPERRITPAEIGELYADLAVRMVLNR